MGIVIGGLVPHPPLLIPEIGGRELKKVEATQRAMTELAKRIKDADVEILLTISPHGPVFTDSFSIFQMPYLEGDFDQYDGGDVLFKVGLAQELIGLIGEKAQESGFPVKLLDKDTAQFYQISLTLDHGVMIPLYFLARAGVQVPLVPINIGLLAYEDIFAFGQILQEVLEEYPARLGVVASGDLSHRLIPNAPAGFSLRGKEFDEKILTAIKEDKLSGLIDIEDNLVEKAGECGLRPLLLLAGIIEGLGLQGELLSYEGPFGVGYAVASFINRGGPEKQFSPSDLAKEAVNKYIREKETLPRPAKLPEFLLKPGGAFVSIHKKSGELRGCMGTIEATHKTLAEEIISNAISAASQDPRFQPIRPEELADLQFSVDILEPPGLVKSIAELDHRRYGIIVEKDNKRGLLLPDLTGIDSIEEQIAVACLKAGIKYDADVLIKKFQVVRYS